NIFEKTGVVKVLIKDTNLKLDLKEYSPVFSRHLGVNVIHSNVALFRRACKPAFKALPIHLFVETGVKLMNILKRIDNKPIEVMDLMQ
ncbi:21402_t:CDS:2, partial [Dentiscutata erythropus]